VIVGSYMLFTHFVTKECVEQNDLPAILWYFIYEKKLRSVN